ncbi:MAG: ATP-dependent RecD-like DNA helicase [Firmicutes bacterium]|jgi:exodeoxyribonuclease V alpha subunit|nr:ATP-dependent RecD-like DNA helicase [Bacillota bacterium]MDH7495176.1 ATP-dependent RecD-like DNA helicase [Bacillota bacterium]
MPSIKGTVERITYRNDQNFYTVARLTCTEWDTGRDGSRNVPEAKAPRGGASGRPALPVTVVGTFPFITVGEKLLLHGEWVDHPKHGRQFKVESYESIAPATLKGIERYLGSGLIKGIGPATAKKLVSHFGLDALDVIEREPERLTEVEGVGPVKSAAIARAFQEQKEIRKVMVFLAGHGVSPALAIKIFRRYGDASIQAVRENPYRLADEIYGVGFKTADKIAAELGIEPTASERVAAGVMYVLNELAADGHVYYPEEALLGEAAEVLGVERDLVAKALPDLEERGAIVRDEVGGEKAVYLAYLYRAETSVATRLAELARYPSNPLSVDVTRLLAEVRRRDGVQLSAEQQAAVEKATKSGVLVLTGGPGTGKTTTVRTLLRVFEAAGLRIALAAPTGRAAKKLAETTRREAKTIHRLLGVSFGQGQMSFEHNEGAPVDADVLILDETSMIDIQLMSYFLAAVKPGAKLILVGDVDQLPSVGPGSVLRDAISSGTVEVVRLTEIFRQARTSMIVTNAHRVNRGEMPLMNRSFTEGGKADFFFIAEEDPEKVAALVRDLVTRRLPAYVKCDPIDDIQVMAPMRRTVTGVENLNTVLRDALNPAGHGKQEIRMGGFVLREGDKVMQVRNNYDKMVFNGDIGRVVKVNPEDQEVVVAFVEPDGVRRVTYEQHEMDELVLSYAISVHKSQGSEYPVIVMPITTQHFVMLQRNLLYTAITRAKRLVVLVGTCKALAIAVKNSTQDRRYSGLAERLARLRR